jgi:hypothetical protein
MFRNLTVSLVTGSEAVVMYELRFQDSPADCIRPYFTATPSRNTSQTF